MGAGSGRSKKEAEQAAAERALEGLRLTLTDVVCVRIDREALSAQNLTCI